MDDSLKDVLAAATDCGAAGKPVSADGPSRRAPLLRAVDNRPAVAPQPATGTPELMSLGVLGNGAPFGRSGLRLAFWLCGFHETLRDRQSRGETLSQRETSLLALSGKDFAAIRPAVIQMAIEHLQSVLSQTERHGASQDRPVPVEMEAFAFSCLFSLAARAAELLRDKGSDAALSLFGGGPTVQEPLAIFQLVFSTAVGLAESFVRLIPEDAALLDTMIESLGSAVERI